MMAFFHAAIFLAAFLSFSIQPLAGKTILPLIGGAPQGWLVTLAFFQTTLLAGYALVYLLRRVDARVAAGLIAAALGLGSYLQPVHAQAVPLGGGFDLFVYLWQWLGVRLVCLGAMAPLVQRLFFSAGAVNPYRLYAVSNAGSLLGLLSYPFIVEPLLGLHRQIVLWQGGIAVLLLALIGCIVAGRPVPREAPAPAHPPLQLILTWALLAMLPASLLSGTTLLVSTDIAPFPLMWVIPLSLYLLTFILAFRGWQAKRVTQSVFVLTVVSALLIGTAISGTPLAHLMSAWLFLLLVFGVFTLAAFVCHSRLYALSPDGSHLPLFYVAIAAGGAIGGSFNAFAAPLLFNQANEFYLTLALIALALAPLPGALEARPAIRLIMRGCVVTLLVFVVLPVFASEETVIKAAGIAVITACALAVFAPRLFGLAAVAALALQVMPLPVKNQELRMRNFFGVLSVSESADKSVRYFIHGSTLHGQQPADPAWKGKPVSYYGETGPLGDAMALRPEGRVAVVGLGTGQAACYATPARQIDFYEIDPDVETIARTWFTYLSDCGAGDIVIGDARLTLAQSTQAYDIIVLDAFSSDAIPMHLLTAEALAVYRSRLKPGGLVLFHISNKYLSLDTPLAATARDMGLAAMSRYHHPDLEYPYDSSSQWVAVSDDSAALAALGEKHWRRAIPRGRGWSDDYAPLLWAIGRVSVPVSTEDSGQNGVE